MLALYRYFVIAEAVASGYSLIVLFISSKSLLRHLVMILDVEMKLSNGLFQPKKKKKNPKYVCYINKKKKIKLLFFLKKYIYGYLNLIN